jgi:hypothetical protein
MCTPEIPIRIGKRFPIDFAVVSDIQRVNSESPLVPSRRESIGTHSLMNKDVGISCAPPRFHAVILECFTEGISPGDVVL